MPIKYTPPKRKSPILAKVAPPGGRETPGAKLERELLAERKKRDAAVNNSRNRK